MRLLIIAPNAMLISLLSKVLGDEDDIEVIAGVSDLNEARRFADQAEIVAYHADVAGSSTI